VKGWILMDAFESHWRNTQPRLHEFNGTVSDFLESESVRKAWLDALAQYPIAIKTGEVAREQWRGRERQYFEHEIFVRDNKLLRDRTITPANLYPGHYRRKLSAVEFAAIPSGMRKASYWDWEPKPNGGFKRKAHKCFHPFIADGKETGGGTLDVAAWVPEDLIKFDDSLLCHHPLPPENGRHYSLPEICYGLTVLHDIDGSFGRIVPRNSQLYVDLGYHFALLLGGRGHGATDGWVPGLVRLLRRAKQLVPTAKTRRAAIEHGGRHLTTVATPSNGEGHGGIGSQIPQEYLTRVVTKGVAARLHSGAKVANPTTYLARLIDQHLITPPLGSGKQWQFDIRQFPESARASLR
jgi:hypothetical protein